MATREISEEDFLANERLRSTLGKVVGNKEAKKLVEKALKLVDPTAVTPTLDAEAEIDSRIAATGKELAEFKAEQAKKDSDREAKEAREALTNRIEKGLEALRAKGVTAAGIEGVRKIMEEEGILNPEIAWAHFEKMHPPPEPTNPSGTGAWNFLDMPGEGDSMAEDLKKLIETKGESEQLTRKMSNDALNEIRGQSRR